jgi:hypothetical protein
MTSASTQTFEQLMQQDDYCIRPSDIVKRQTIITSAHRTTLIEWICEVCWDWTLDPTVAFKTVQYLDHFLSQTNVQNLGRYVCFGNVDCPDI